MSLCVDIKKRYKGFTLEVAFSSDDGTLALLGASGSGKSMTLKCIAGLISPDEGLITANGRTLFDSAAHIDLRPQQRGVGYLFQNYALFPNMTIRQNIAVAYRGADVERSTTIQMLLERYELDEQADKYPVQLSGGQQQRAALARIFAYKPGVLLLDEPFSALDSFLRENMQAELKRIIKGYDGDVVLVTHSRDEAYKIADRLVILDAGRPVADGSVKGVFARPGNTRTARITGCKNISRIERTGDRSFVALDWGIVLEAAEPLAETHTHAGIRAHDFSPVSRRELGAETAGNTEDRAEDGAEGGTTDGAETGTVDDPETRTTDGTKGGTADGAESRMAGKNIFAVEVLDVIEGPFEKDVIVRATGMDAPIQSANDTTMRKEIWWITDRNVKIDEQCALTVRPEDILLLTE